eukprot:10302378-Alexandrium_andersonii.AAC.1
MVAAPSTPSGCAQSSSMRQKSGDAWMSGPRPRTVRFASATWPARAPMSSSVASPSDDAAASPRGAVAGVPPGTPA